MTLLKVKRRALGTYCLPRPAGALRRLYSMHRLPIRASALIPLTLFGTTFSLAAEPPPAVGTVSVEVSNDDNGLGDVANLFADAVSTVLAEKGFTLLDDPAHSAYVVKLSFSRAEVGTGPGRVGTGDPNITKGGAQGSVGSGVRIPIRSGKWNLVALERTQVEMQFHRRGQDLEIWHGSAVTVRASDARDRAATDLCNALLRDYPAEPEGIISVP